MTVSQCVFRSFVAQMDVLRCAFDDDRRMYLKVPPHEYNYAKSKGAWWDLDSQRFYLYREPVDDPWTRDVGAMYDMRPTDWENLRQVFGGGV